MKNNVLETNKTLIIKSAALTDQGRRRKLNEDAVFHRTDQTHSGRGIGLYMVCDGLGGHQAGEVASRLAVEMVAEELVNVLLALKVLSDSDYTRPSYMILSHYIETAIKKANGVIRDYAQAYPDEAGNLGATITLALVYRDTAYIANVGDSRTYLWRAGQVTQITRDHSVAAELAAVGKIEESDIPGHPFSKVLCRALGTDDEVNIDLFERPLQPNDRLFLCSDGLWQAFPDKEELAHWFGLAVTPAQLCQRLVAEANERDGRDNISVVAINIDGVPSWKKQFMSAKTVPTSPTTSLTV